MLGLLGAWLGSQPAPANHVLSLITAGRLELSSPLRWHAHLRDEPADFPWGVSLDLALDSVEFEGSRLDVRGGMRLAHSPIKDEAPLPACHKFFATKAHLIGAYTSSSKESTSRQHFARRL